MSGEAEYRTAPTRVLVVDDRQLLAEALCLALSAQAGMEVVGALTDPSRLAQEALHRQPDVLLLNYYTLTRLGGAAAVAEARAEMPSLKLVVLTKRDDEDTLLECVRAGAAGRVTEDSEAATLAVAVQRIHAGEVLFPTHILVQLLTRPQEAPRRSPSGARLAPRELEVLRTLASGASTDDAAARLGITAHTVRTHLKNAMAKLEAHSKLEAVLIALRAGLIRLPD